MNDVLKLFLDFVMYLVAWAVIYYVPRAARWAMDKAGARGMRSERVGTLPQHMLDPRTDLEDMAPCSHAFGWITGILVSPAGKVHVRVTAMASPRKFTSVFAVYKDHAGRFHVYVRRNARIETSPELSPELSLEKVYVEPDSVSVVSGLRFHLLLNGHLRKRAERERLASEVMET